MNFLSTFPFWFKAKFIALIRKCFHWYIWKPEMENKLSIKETMLKKMFPIPEVLLKMQYFYYLWLTRTIGITSMLHQYFMHHQLCVLMAIWWGKPMRNLTCFTVDHEKRYLRLVQSKCLSSDRKDIFWKLLKPTGLPPGYSIYMCLASSDINRRRTWEQQLKCSKQP